MATLKVRVDKTLRKNARAALKRTGLTVDEAVALFLHQVTVDQGLPFRPSAVPTGSKISIECLTRELEQAKKDRNIARHGLADPEPAPGG